MSRTSAWSGAALVWISKLERISASCREDLATHWSLGSDRPCLWLATHGSGDAVQIAATKVLIRIRDNRLLGEESQLEEDGTAMEWYMLYLVLEQIGQGQPWMVLSAFGRAVICPGSALGLSGVDGIYGAENSNKQSFSCCM
ncbi:hypothetical protein V8E52_008787, partial [Russula decolorans]